MAQVQWIGRSLVSVEKAAAQTRACAAALC